MRQQIALPDRRTFEELTRLAAYMVRPLEFVHNDYLSLPPLSGAAIQRLNADGCFSGPLNRAASQMLGLSQLSLSPGFTARLKTESDLKIALKLLRSERAAILALARSCAAIQLFPQIRLCVLKSQRNRMEAILGADEFVAAVREAPAFYHCLPERSGSVELDTCLDDDERVDQQETSRAATSREPADIVHPVVWEGLRTLIAFIRRADPACATLFSLRFPRPAAGGSPAAAAITDAQAAELKMLLRHRGLTW